MTTQQYSPEIIHHGALHGVTGSCHEYRYAPGQGKSVLIDCGLFQGDDHSSHGADSANSDQLLIDFDLSAVQALVVTHAHIDHIGRIPYLLMAGFDLPILCTEATALIMPLMLRDAIHLGITSDRRLGRAIIEQIESLIVPVPYNQWHPVDECLQLRFQSAGHILGSAYVEFDCCSDEQSKQRVVFSGDLGTPNQPLLTEPRSPETCDTLVIESTYGDRQHDGQEIRKQVLRQTVERCFENQGAILMPAFSLGRTQSVLYEFEQIVHEAGGSWADIDIVVDSPMANRITSVYRQLTRLWDDEARETRAEGRHPLNFEQMIVIDDHQTHQQVVDYLRKTGRPAVVIAASGMCTGGRIMHYLESLIEDARTDIVFTGYQAHGSIGWQIQKYGDKTRYPNGYVKIDDRRFDINAGVYSISGYSAHADQQDLLNFVTGIENPPGDIRIVHGDEPAKAELQRRLIELLPGSQVTIP